MQLDRLREEIENRKFGRERDQELNRTKTQIKHWVSILEFTSISFEHDFFCFLLIC